MMDKPLFIGGFRSGTTLLVNLLGMHPVIAPWFETKGLCELLRWMRVVANPAMAEVETPYVVPADLPGFDLDSVLARMRWDFQATDARIQGRVANGKAAHERYPIGADCAAYSLSEAQALLARWAEETGHHPTPLALAMTSGNLIRDLALRHCQHMDRPIWINKTPEICRFAPEIRQAMGGCRIIYMVRNGLDVVSSAHGLGWGAFEALVFNWQGLLTHTRLVMEGFAEDYLELRYEDLLRDPEAMLGQVFDFAGLDSDPAAIISRFRREYGAGAFDTSRIGAHPPLSVEQKAAFLQIAGDMQAELGYPLP